MLRLCTGILLLGTCAAGSAFQRNQTAELLGPRDLAAVTGKECFRFISHDCTTSTLCLNSYPGCGGSCSHACTGPGSHRYCLGNGSFYETCDTVSVVGCGSEVFGQTCSAGPLGGCVCTGQATTLPGCSKYETRNTSYCGG